MSKFPAILKNHKLQHISTTTHHIKEHTSRTSHFQLDDAARQVVRITVHMTSNEVRDKKVPTGVMLQAAIPTPAPSSVSCLPNSEFRFSGHTVNGTMRWLPDSISSPPRAHQIPPIYHAGRGTALVVTPSPWRWGSGRTADCVVSCAGCVACRRGRSRDGGLYGAESAGDGDGDGNVLEYTAVLLCFALPTSSSGQVHAHYTCSTHI